MKIILNLQALMERVKVLGTMNFGAAMSNQASRKLKSLTDEAYKGLSFHLITASFVPT